MVELLTAVMLVALSVSKLEAELDSKEYGVDAINEALAYECAKGDDARKTAIEALEGAMCDALVAEIVSLDANATIEADASHDDLTAQLKAVKETLAELEDLAEAEPVTTGYKVAKGKSITTSAGIKSEGQEVTANMVTGGADKLKVLKDKGHLV